MKVTVNAEMDDKSFPKIMRTKRTGTLVYFIRSEYGLTLLDRQLEYPCDFKEETAEGWDMDLFEDFIGSITIYN